MATDLLPFGSIGWTKPRLQKWRSLTRMGNGNFSNVKGVGQGVFENRIDFGPGYRIYFGLDGSELVVLLIGGSKKTQRQDIETAKQYWRNYNA